MERSRFENSPVGSLTEISGLDGRFGAEYNHIAFIPDPLGHEPELLSETWRAVGDARAALARLDQASKQVEGAWMLRRPTLSREAQSTSALEGTFAPLEQVIEADSLESRSKNLQEVLNYMKAADFAFDAIDKRPHLTVGLLESVHRILVAGTEADTDQAGHVRTVQVAIGSPSGSVEDARFVPMPPGISLNVAVRDLVDWISTTKSMTDPIVSAAVAHYQFETLHPFNDGNGRIGRLLIVLQLMVSGNLTEPLLSVSPWFEARRTHYQDLLSEVSATGKWDNWVMFFAQGVAASADDVAARVDRLLELHQSFVAALQESGARGIIRDIVDELISQPIVTIPGLAKKYKKTVPAVTSALQKLIELKILQEPNSKYGRRFIATDVLKTILARPGEIRS